MYLTTSLSTYVRLDAREVIEEEERRRKIREA